jgi:hypothetical protein
MRTEEAYMPTEINLSALQKQVQANSLGLVVITIDLYLYKSQIAQRRWGTPGGNDVALEHYQAIQRLLARTPWPAELADAAAALDERIERFRVLLKAKDQTRVSFESTRLAADFHALQEGLLAWASAAA